MKKNKYLPYVLFGVPLVLGGFFLYKYIKNKSANTSTDTTPSTDTSPISTIKDIIAPTYTTTDKLPLKKGSAGDLVKKIQAKLGVNADGKFGAITQGAVVKFQKSNNLSADGIVGVNTWKALFGADFPNEFAQSSTSVLSNNPIITPKFSSNTWE
jgi:peptidoglycan hydrolase-like protein with peptidoglycan-binding domain